MLTPIDKPRKRQNFLTYDLEWHPHTLELRLIGVYDGDQYRDYTNVSQFFEHELCAANSGKRFYAHAGGGYDSRFILAHLLRHREDMSARAAFVGSSAVVITIKRGKLTWKLLDSYFLLRTSLRNIGDWMGQKKGGKEEKKKCLYPKSGECLCDPIFFAPYYELRDYNEGDCKILWDAIARFEDTVWELGGEMKATIGATSMDLFRRKYLKREIRTHESINQIALDAYIASRVEVFQRKCETAWCYDINSSFPHAMTLDNAPGKIKRIMKSLPSSGPYLAHCKITVDSNIPPLGFRNEDRRIYFPNGTWENWFSHIDVELLLRSGGRVEWCDKSLTFEPISDLAEYAIDIYERRRRSSDEGFRVILKFLLNALYGKFAEGTLKEAMLFRPNFFECPHIRNGKKQHPQDECLRMTMPGVWLITEEMSIPHRHVPIATHITAIARRSLYEHLIKPKNVYYCDTDGFSCDSDDLETGDGLGQLKDEGRILQGHFLAPKLYAIQKESGDWKVRAKGFSKLSYEEFVSLSEHREVWIPRFVRFREAIARGEIDPSNIISSKFFRDKMRPKRCFSEDGSSSPWDVRQLLA